jgi:hypothetical protein
MPVSTHTNDPPSDDTPAHGRRPASRAAGTREQSQRLTHRHRRPNAALGTPRLKGSGKVWRWVRELLRGVPDQPSVHSAIDEGYRPATLDDLADDDTLRRVAQLTAMSGGGTGGTDGIRYGGLIGMIIDEEVERDRLAEIQEDVDASTDAANALFDMQREADGGRGGLPVVREDRGSYATSGSAAVKNSGMGAP